MRKIHFYKAKSRLGIINPLVHQNDLNFGVEDAPNVILTKEFLSHFNSAVSEYNFSKPENIDRNKYFDFIYKEYSSFEKFINKTLKHDEAQVVIGGDNSITFPSINALLNRVKDSKRIGYIQFDSHGDMNLFKTSPTKNFHGMYLRPFLDNFDIPKIDSLIPSKIPLANILFIGDVDLDIEEKMYFDKEKLRNINRDEVLRDTKRVIDEVKSFISKFQFIHVNFDVDVFNLSEVQATGIPSTNTGFVFGELVPLLNIISQHPRLSIDISEVNPQKEGRDKTIKIAQKVLSAILLVFLHK